MMTNPERQPSGALLIGSVPLGSAAEAFRTASSILGDRLLRIPDGETGDRSNWIAWQAKVIEKNPCFELVPQEATEYAGLRPFRLRPKIAVDEIKFGPLGYADAAKSSYAKFAQMKAEGLIPAHCRFQISLPTPLAPMTAYITDEDRAAVEPLYEAQLLSELAEMVRAIPEDELAIQWDVAVEFGILEGVFWKAHFSDPEGGIIERLVRLCDAVPGKVEVGYHLCYGDSGHQHFKQPKDAAMMVLVANRVAADGRRKINWMHLPVPRNRTDDAFYAPLRHLTLHPETELYLGLVHYTDGVEGTRKRIEIAQRAVPSFGVATECGMGRRPPETVPDLMRIHAEVAGPAGR
jgi:hypothetical protein